MTATEFCTLPYPLEHAVVGGKPTSLALFFDPESIRDHFGDDLPEGITNEQLATVGLVALQDDRLYKAFHEALERAARANGIEFADDTDVLDMLGKDDN